VFMDFADRQWR